jgi:hypothetical protein
MSSHLTGMRALLQHMFNGIQKARTEALGKNKIMNVDHAKYEAFFADLERQAGQLRQMAVSLARMEAVETQRQNGIRGVPHDQRFREQQSINSKMASIKEVQRMAVQVQTALDGLFDVSTRPTTANLIEGIYKEFKKLGERIDSGHALIAAQSVGKEPVYRNADLGHGIKALDALTQLWLAIAMLLAAIELRRNR